MCGAGRAAGSQDLGTIRGANRSQLLINLHSPSPDGSADDTLVFSGDFEDDSINASRVGEGWVVGE